MSEIRLSKNKKARDAQLQNIEFALDYILESEWKDFLDSGEEVGYKNHIYYKAYSALYGKEKAGQMVNDLKKEGL